VLLQRGKGHALTHQYHGAEETATGARRFIPSFSTGALVAVIVAFMLGGLVVSVADELAQASPAPSHATALAPLSRGTSESLVTSPRLQVGQIRSGSAAAYRYASDARQLSAVCLPSPHTAAKLHEDRGGNKQPGYLGRSLTTPCDPPR
jgi:preprotein translocase subunit SecG